MEVDAGAAKSPWGGQWKSIRRPIRVFGALEVGAVAAKSPWGAVQGKSMRWPLRVLGAARGSRCGGQ